MLLVVFLADKQLRGGDDEFEQVLNVDIPRVHPLDVNFYIRVFAFTARV